MRKGRGRIQKFASKKYTIISGKDGIIVQKSKKRNTSRFFAAMLFIFVIYTLDLYCIYKFFQSKIEKSFIAKDINRSLGWYIKEVVRR